MKRLNFNSKWTKITLKHVHTPSMWIKAIYFQMRTLFMKHFKSIRCFYWISLKWHNTVFTFPQIIAHILKHTLFSWMKIDFTLMARKIQHWRWWWKKNKFTVKNMKLYVEGLFAFIYFNVVYLMERQHQIALYSFKERTVKLVTWYNISYEWILCYFKSASL